MSPLWALLAQVGSCAVPLDPLLPPRPRGAPPLAQQDSLNNSTLHPSWPTRLLDCPSNSSIERTVISGEDNVRSLRESPRVDFSPPSPSDGIAIMAINYLILLSRQGKVVRCPPSSWAPFRLAAQS